MNDKKRALFSFSVKDDQYFNDKQEKIELVSCQRDGNLCKGLLSDINNDLLESGKYRRNKEFTQSIEILKNSFYKTFELQESHCLKCAELFRSVITNSLEEIHKELKGMSTGIFGSKRYQASYILADDVLKDFKKES